jgi:xanthine/uracil/vitamin C permease (AzgA family)
MRTRVLVIGLACVVVLVGDVAPAVAATSDIGKHVGAEVKSWATVLLLGVAGLVAIPVLAKRDVNGGVVLALLVVLVGGFAFAPDSVKHAIESLWKSIAG